VSTRAKPKLGQYIEKLYDSLTELAGEYRKLGERHAAEQDVFHLSHALAKECEAQAAALASHAKTHAGDVPEAAGEGRGESLLSSLRRATSAMVGHSPASGLLLLRDLRQLHLAIEEAAMLWLIVSQGAHAARDRELLDLAQKSREEITHQLMWVSSRIKETAPQALLAE
jgi:hypothetical protein